MTPKTSRLMSDIECAYNFFPLFFCHASLATRHTDREQGGRSVQFGRSREEERIARPSFLEPGLGEIIWAYCAACQGSTPRFNQRKYYHKALFFPGKTNKQGEHPCELHIDLNEESL